MFLSINCQFLDGYNIKIMNLFIVEFDECATGQNIKIEVLNCLEAYKIELCLVFTITIDNGTNLVKALKLLNSDNQDKLLQI